MIKCRLGKISANKNILWSYCIFIWLHIDIFSFTVILCHSEFSFEIIKNNWLIAILNSVILFSLPKWFISNFFVVVALKESCAWWHIFRVCVEEKFYIFLDPIVRFLFICLIFFSFQIHAELLFFFFFKAICRRPSAPIASCRRSHPLTCWWTASGSYSYSGCPSITPWSSFLEDM